MTLSSLYLKPALTTVISGAVTDSVITSSPAILLGVIPGGVHDGSYDYSGGFKIKNGTIEIISGLSNHQCTPYQVNSGGIDCPNGIKVTTYSTSAVANYIANCRLTINYILK